MRIEGRGSEVDLEVIRQTAKQVSQQKTLESIRKEIEDQTKKIAEEKQVQNQDQNKIDNEQLQKIIQEIQRKFDYFNRYLKITIDDELEIPVVKILEKDTNRLIRQIPPDYLLELMKKIDEMLGVLMNERV